MLCRIFQTSLFYWSFNPHNDSPLHNPGLKTGTWVATTPYVKSIYKFYYDRKKNVKVELCYDMVGYNSDEIMSIACQLYISIGYT